MKTKMKLKFPFKLKLRTISLFLVGWLTGLMFFYFYEHHDINSNDKTLSRDVYSVDTIENFVDDIQNFTSTADDTGEDLTFFFIWPNDARLFSLYNYNALESLLSTYPKASYRTLSFIDSKTPVNMHDWRDKALGSYEQLHTQHFARYRKQGYDIDFIEGSDIIGGIGMKFAKSYVLEWASRCCPACPMPCWRSRQPLPYHVTFFAGISKLYRSGGVLSDYKHKFSEGLLQQGFDIHAYCDASRKLPLWLREEASLPTYTSPSASRSRNSNSRDSILIRPSPAKFLCSVSTLVVLPAPKHPVIPCVLYKYGADDTFLSCLREDTLYGGALCIDTALHDCFTQHRLKNILRRDESILETFQHNPKAAARFIMSSSGVDLNAAEVVLEGTNISSAMAGYLVEPYKTVFWLGDLAECGDWSKDPLSLQISESGKQEKTSSMGMNENKSTSTTAETSTEPKYHSCNQILSCTPFSQTLPYLKYLGISRSTWDTGIERASCAPSVILVGFRHSSVSYLVSELARHPQVLPPLHDYSDEWNFEVGDDDYGTGKLVGPYTSRSPKGLLLRPWSFSYIPHIQRQDGGYARALDSAKESQYHASYVSLDASSSYPLDYITPFIIRQDNPQAKIIFTLRHPVHRMYADYIHSYRKLKEQLSGPNADPLLVSFNSIENSNKQRLPAIEYRKARQIWASFRALSAGFDTLADLSMAYATAFSHLRRQLVNASSRNSTIQHSMIKDYYASVATQASSVSLGLLFPHSIAYPVISHYTHVFGRRTIFVVLADWEDTLVTDTSLETTRLMLSRRHAVMALDRFIDVCPRAQLNVELSQSRRSGNSNVNRIEPLSGQMDDADDEFAGKAARAEREAAQWDDSDLPPELRMTQQTYIRLTNFFSPFVTALTDITQLNLTAWKLPRPEIIARLQALSNSSLTTAWFEPDFQSTVRKQGRVGGDSGNGLIGKLLPKASDGVDNSYNTTLAMLSVFG